MGKIAVGVSLFFFFQATVFAMDAVDKQKFLGVTQNQLANIRDYTQDYKFDQALECIAQVDVEKLKPFRLEPEGRILYTQFQFYSLVTYYNLLDRPKAEALVKLLLAHFDELEVALRWSKDRDSAGFSSDPIGAIGLSRYKLLTQMMERDLKAWGERDLSEVERLMKLAGQRLSPGIATRKNIGETDLAQKKAIKILEDLIKEQEQKQKGGGEGAKNPGDPKDPNGGQPKNGEAKKGDPSTNPAGESIVMGGQGKGKVDDKQLRKIAESWGTLPAAQRARVVQEITRELPPKYEQLIKEYFKALDRTFPSKN